MSNKTLTREQLDRHTSFAHADDGERASLYALLDERDELRAERDAIFKALPVTTNGDADLPGQVRSYIAERDQFAADRAGAVDALLAMTAERDDGRAEGARLRERVKRLEAALVKVRDDFNHAHECSTDDDDDVAGCECAKAIAVAALSPTTDGAPKLEKP